MAIVKRHWGKLFGLLMVLVVGALLVHLYGLPAKADPGTAAAAGIDKVAAGRIKVLRQKICLTNQDLAAMGCSGDTATVVLNGLVGWYQSNKDALAKAQKGQSDAFRATEALRVRMNVGPADPQLPVKARQLAEAFGSASKVYEDLIAQCKSAVTSGLSDSQKSVWAASQANRGMSARYRYLPGISPDQRKALIIASETAARTAAMGKGDDARQSLGTAEGQILTGPQKAARDSAQAALAQNLAAVAQADKAVLGTSAAR